MEIRDNGNIEDEVKIDLGVANSAPDPVTEEVEVPDHMGGLTGTNENKQDAEWEPKTLHNSDISGARENVPDIQVVGDGDTFKLICKASSKAEGWMKSTKAMQTPHGVVVQVTTQQKGIDGTYACAEALTYVPGCKVKKDGDTHKLVTS